MSLGSIESESDSESVQVDQSWYEENKDILQELNNVGLKTPKSIKKTLRRRTTKLGKMCTCKGNCSTRICGCVKESNKCDSKCRCSLEKCQNRGDPDSDLEISIPNDGQISKKLDLLLSESEEEAEKENIANSTFTLSPAKRASNGITKSKSKKVKSR